MAPTSLEQNTTLRIQRRFAAPIALVYAAWTQPEHLKRWHAPDAYKVVLVEADVRPGGRFRLRMKAPDKEIYHTAAGEYEVVEPEKRLVYTWQWEEETSDRSLTRITILFEADGLDTVVDFTQARLKDQTSRDNHRGGWEGSFANLDKYLESMLGNNA